ncbi:peroxiredoxin [Flavicella sediminum]|uniref:peroxiredoxin n=1 Tax=Flavicella sediminum TaxID=2585141 RepID=UPI001AA0858A|nr:peroxiredoxin [Flavicella sediminum]
MKNRMNYFFVGLILFLGLQINAQTKELNLGDNIPKFSALDASGKEWKSVKNVKSDFLVVYFYPAAMTGGCTKQACAYRDDKASFDALNVQVIGVSGDEVKNLAHFRDAYNLNFPLLSDADGVIAKLFGVPSKLGERSIKRELDGLEVFLKRNVTTSRWTFVFDRKGN